MKDFNRWLNTAANLAIAYRSLESIPNFQPKVSDGNVIMSLTSSEMIRARPSSLDLYRWDAFCRTMGQSLGTGLEAWTFAGLWTEGIKVYCPTVDECNALSQVELKVPWTIYRQPFDTMAVVLPDGYFKSEVSADLGRPVCCILRAHRNGGLLATSIAGIRDRDLICPGAFAYFPWKESDVETIESHLKDLENVEVEVGEFSKSESEICDRVRRIAINSCLLLTQHGARRLGSASPEYAANLREKLKKKGIPENIREANRNALLAIPELYGFDQHIRIYDREDGPHDATGTGSSPKPHWRRGHWRQQPFGTGGQQRRLVFIRPVLVNAHRFAGTPADTRVTMTTEPS